ncbi:MAG TPA: DUF4175 family protein [Polyangia bacterium]
MVQPVEAGGRGAGVPPPPGPEPPAAGGRSVQAIGGFLAAVRRRLLLRAALRTAGYGAAAASGAVLVLALAAATVGPASFWPTLTATVLGALALVAVVAGLWRPARALRHDRAAARHAGALLPELASDLLSAVELAAPNPPDPRAAAVSAGLVRAFQEYVAGSVGALDARRLVSLRPAARAIAAAVAGLAALIAAAVLSPTTARGLRTLVHRPSLFEGAAVSTVPLVGDVRITYSYPPYTGLPPRTVEGSTGDVAAVKGTRVRIETHPLRSTRRALLLLGEAGDKGEAAVALAGNTLTAELTLNEDAAYRFWLQPPLGRAVREARSHHLTVEADAPPRVDILGPADRLELTTPRPIEIGYSASDDYGVGIVELVFRAGDRPEQRVQLRDGAGARTVQGRTLWDPATAGLGSAERIAYHIEARDRDDVSPSPAGSIGKSASSRTLYVIIQNPHESLEDRLERQRELLEKLIGDLAQRLERGTGDDAAAALAGYVAVHDAEESHLALLGQLIDEDRRNGTLGKALRAPLAGIADRLEHVLRDEARVLATFKGKPAGPGGVARLDALAPKHVAELETDVLLLDDLIGRQRLEDLAALGKELTDAHQRLRDLLERYQKTKDPALRRQLEREARELRARLAELASKIAAVKARNDVPEEWRNMPDLKNVADQARKLDEMLEKGNDADLEKALAELGNDLNGLRKMLDQNADGFGAERFPQENRVVADLMKKIGDIEGDERSLHKETQAAADRQEAEIEKRMRAQIDEFIKKEAEKVERLKQRLAGIPSGHEGSLAEELERARDSARQVRRLLGERDLSEAKAEAERAEGSLERAAEHLDEIAEARRARKPSPEPEHDKRADAVGEARALAQEIADDLAKQQPRAADAMTPQDREAARGQAERQGAIGKRTDDVAGEAERKLRGMPGMEKAESELKGASQRMRQAGESLRKDDSKGAAAAERDAADRLAKLRDSMQDRSMGGSRQRHDPVRIPGADESSAPRAWRQELLDAMKEKAPERFRDEVRRYYEELVR